MAMSTLKLKMRKNTRDRAMRIPIKALGMRYFMMPGVLSAAALVPSRFLDSSVAREKFSYSEDPGLPEITTSVLSSTLLAKYSISLTIVSRASVGRVSGILIIESLNRAFVLIRSYSMVCATSLTLSRLSTV